MSAVAAYEQFAARLRLHADLGAALRLLEWDQETFMPSGTLEARARQIGALAAMLHQHHTEAAFLDLVDDLAANLSQLDAPQAVDVREAKWRLDRTRALDPELVRERSGLHAHARGVWIAARRDDDFAALAPYLTRIIALERQVAAAIDPHRDPYDVMLEGYEPGTDTAAVAALFAELRDGLVPLVTRLVGGIARRPPSQALQGDFPLAQQRQLNRAIAERLGFDFRLGRLDEAAHPFTTSIGGDVRLTTRYDPHDLRYALYSTIHETGHGLYEQGLDPAARALPRGQSCSLGIHESQSRLWENQIGRSVAFWELLLPLAGALFPSLDQMSIAAVVAAANEARPSLIRTEADEITYNLHIILRFELERALVDGTLAAVDLPEAWRAKMQQYLGIVPPNDREGVLQDVHWASGAIGYFPTYALGNVYAAQLLRACTAALGPLDHLIAAGEFAAILEWLRRHVHRFGQTHRPTALIAAATGETPTCRWLLEHLAQKLTFLESA